MYRSHLSGEVKHDKLRRLEAGLGVASALPQVRVVVQLKTHKKNGETQRKNIKGA